jgi:uncharacterized protein (TIGR03000 family)
MVQLPGGGAVNYFPGGVNYPSGYYFGVANQTPAYMATAPTYLTSINYPTVYGAYSTFPYVGSVAPTSAVISPFNALPTSPAVVVLSAPQNPPIVTPTLSTATLTAQLPRTTTITTELPAGVRASGTSAVININVPQSAELRIQGRKMTMTGGERQFVSPPLDPGQRYSYNVTATWNENGKPITQTQRVIVRAGDRTGVTFLGQADRGNEATLRTTEPTR